MYSSNLLDSGPIAGALVPLEEEAVLCTAGGDSTMGDCETPPALKGG